MPPDGVASLEVALAACGASFAAPGSRDAVSNAVRLQPVAADCSCALNAMQPSTIATNQLRQTRTKSDMNRILMKIMWSWAADYAARALLYWDRTFLAPVFQSLLSSVANQKAREFRCWLV